MPRPRTWRRVCRLPQCSRFGPLDAPGQVGEPVVMTVDEYETIRLIDWEGLTQAECAEQMQVSRTTVQSVYASARRKLADALVHGIQLWIAGGDYLICEDTEPGCGRGCRRRCTGHAHSRPHN